MSAYDLASLKLPVLSGAALRAFAATLDTRMGRAALTGSLLASGGITRLRELEIDTAPLFIPHPPPDEKDGRAKPSRGSKGPSKRDLGRCAQPSRGAAPSASAGDYAAAYASGTQSPLDVAERFLDALGEDARSGKPLNPFIAVDPDDVRRQARESAERHRRGSPLGPLDGVPVAIKDEVDMVPYPTTVGTSFLGSTPAARDATPVARLRAAGALLLGKANMHEIGINPTGHNVHHGHTRNPYDPDHDTGGSSSGPATAVAAGLAPVALGADGGGSIRVPAAHCGLVGLKPTFGRVSESGAAPVAWTVGHLGPIGATVADVALAYALMAGPDPGDPHSLAHPPVSIDGWNRDRLEGVTLGVFRPWFEHAEAEVVDRCDAAVRSLVEAGAEVREIELPGLDALRAAHAVTILSEMATFAARHGARRGDFAPATRISLALARSFTATDYLQAQRVRRQAMQTFLHAYDAVDVIVTPSSAVPAPRIPDDGLPAGISDLGMVTEIMRYAIPGNMLGFPAISVPAGLTPAGLPVGLQAMAAHWREDLLLGVANVVEAAVERPAPRVKWDLLRA